jgi:cell division transport system permease protein
MPLPFYGKALILLLFPSLLLPKSTGFREYNEHCGNKLSGIGAICIRFGVYFILLCRKRSAMAETNGYIAGKTRPNYLYSILSVALVLFTLGFFALALMDARQLVQELKERVSIIVELKQDVAAEEARQLQKELESSPFIKPGSAEYTTKEQAAEFMREDFGDDFLKLGLPNPLYDVITFNVKAAYMASDSLRKIQASLRRHAAVADIYYQESLVNEIGENLRSVGLIALGALAFFIFVAVTLIHNTVRLALYANRFLIKNMELVGASWEFISRPYIRRGAWHGLLSGLLASAALMATFTWLQTALPGLKGLHTWGNFVAILLALCVLGLALNALSTYNVVRKYLKMRVDDLY